MLPIILIVLVIVSTTCLYNNYYNASEIECYFKDGKLHDTIYFKVVDEHGSVSYLHDSGKNPKTLKNNKLDLNILKKEYNEGKFQDIGTPIEIKYGQQIKNLKSSAIIRPENVKDKGLYYTVTINI